MRTRIIEAIRRFRKRARLLAALGGGALTLLTPAIAAAASAVGVGPWDQTLNLLQTDLTGPVAHALVTCAFVGSGVLYATSGGHGPGVNRLAAAGLGGAAALGSIQVMSWLFPYSPMLF